MKIILARAKTGNGIRIFSIKKKEKKKTVTELGINFDFLIVECRSET